MEVIKAYTVMILTIAIFIVLLTLAKLLNNSIPWEIVITCNVTFGICAIGLYIDRQALKKKLNSKQESEEDEDVL